MISRSQRWTISRGLMFTSVFALIGACSSSGVSESPAGSGGASGGATVASGGVIEASGGSTSEDSVDVPIDDSSDDDGAPEGTGGSSVDKSVTTECARTEVSAVDTTTTLPADIIILVDTSGSMNEEVEFVQQNLNAFSQQIFDSGVDARVILIAAPGTGMPSMGRGDPLGVCIASPLGSGTCPDDELLPNYVHLPEEVDSTDALDVLLATFPSWSQHVRPNSVKSIFVVTDDNAADQFERQAERPLDPTSLASSFVEQFEALDPMLFKQWSMNAVYSFTDCEQAANIGTVYAELIALTGGVGGDLCEQNFQPVFDRLAEEVVANAGSEIVCEWEIPNSVEGQTFSTELVEVTRTSAGGVIEALNQVQGEVDCLLGAWHFDDPTNPERILACPETCDAMQEDAEGKIDVVFGCEIVQGCVTTGATSLTEGSNEDPTEMQGCDWPLPKAASGTELDFDSVNVQYVTSKGFGVLLGEVEDIAACGSVDLGWHYDDPIAPTSIVACPNTCVVVTKESVIEVEALFGCKSKPADVVR